ncbi:MAG TPA: 2OG-Fe(II) oxygenase [Nakamurella sp.]
MDPRERLVQLLDATGGRGSFSARRTAQPTHLRIDVTGVGPLTMPVSAAQAKRLIAVARPAQYGQGEHTRTDASVRHTWQVPKSRVRIDRRQWNRTLVPILEGLRDDLGLPVDKRLKAELHSFLVYSPGQFFLPHQDSEKSDDMVGTLTVTLPGPSRGGELIVRHGQQQMIYRSSDRLLSFVAFYADCRHEVKPVTSGYRVVLTYNLLLAGSGAAAPTPGSGETAELAACLAEHFTAQSRLVYLLDHQYTTRGIGWANLKGADAERVRGLAAAARASDCEIALALADVHESWSASEPEEPYDRDRYWYGDPDEDEDDEDDEPDDPDDADTYELDELLESSVTLNAWVDRSGSAAPAVATAVGEDEVCATTPTSALAPYESEYEGYMGNYGNTMDRWYHRGAVVVWPTGLDFEVRAEASPQWALDTLEALIRDGDLTRAREQAESLTSFWKHLRSADSLGEPAGRRPDLGRALAVAHGLDDAGLAAMLLAPFVLEQLTPTHADLLAALTDRHGDRWVRALVAEWSGRPYWHAGVRPGWIAALPHLSGALRDANGRMAARLVLAPVGEQLVESLQRARAITEPSRRAQVLDELAAPITGLLVGAAISEAPEITAATIDVLTDGDDRLGIVLSVLRGLSQADPDVRTGSGFDALARNALARLESRLDRPPRDPDDWSIEPSKCDCSICSILNDFLTDPLCQKLAWPLKEQSRRHVHERIDRYELPVKHATHRVGRPFTLELTKTPALFERETRQRQADEADRDWLRALG